MLREKKVKPITKQHLVYLYETTQVLRHASQDIFNLFIILLIGC